MTTTPHRDTKKARQRSPAVLIVDDDDDIRETLRVCLEEEGFLVRTACNGLEALAHLADGTLPGLILLDLMMPGMNGWEVLEQLQADDVRATIPVAVMSGSHRGEVGAATYVVPKPFDLGAMVDLVREHCADAPDSRRHRTDRQGGDQTALATTAA